MQNYARQLNSYEDQNFGWNLALHIAATTRVVDPTVSALVEGLEDVAKTQHVIRTWGFKLRGIGTKYAATESGKSKVRYEREQIESALRGFGDGRPETISNPLGLTPKEFLIRKLMYADDLFDDATFAHHTNGTLGDMVMGSLETVSFGRFGSYPAKDFDRDLLGYLHLTNRREGEVLVVTRLPNPEHFSGQDKRYVDELRQAYTEAAFMHGVSVRYDMPPAFFG